MKIIAISQFKAYALKIIDQVAKSRESIVITKHGKPIVQVIPYTPNERENKMGKLADTLVFENDVISPSGEETWEACR